MLTAETRDDWEALALAGMFVHRHLRVPAAAFLHEGRRFLVAEWEQHGIDLYAGMERLAKIAPMDKVRDAVADVEQNAGIAEAEAVWLDACEAILREHRRATARVEVARRLEEFQRLPNATLAATAAAALHRLAQAEAPEITAPTGVELFDRLMDEATRTQGREFLGITFPSLPKLNERMDGLRGLTFLAGSPGTGKTSLALQMAFSAAEENQDTVVVFLTCEMSALEVQAALVTRLTGIPFRDLMKGKPLKVHGSLAGVRTEQPSSSTRWGTMYLPQADARRLEDARLRVYRQRQRWRVVHPSDVGGAFMGSKRGGAEVFAPIVALANRAKEASEASRMLVVVDSLQRVPVAEPVSGSVTGWKGEAIDRDNYVVDALNALASGPGDAVLCISEQNKVQQGTTAITSMKGTATIGYACDSSLLLTDPQRYAVKGKDGADIGAGNMRQDIAAGFRLVEAHLVKGRAGTKRGMELLKFTYDQHSFAEQKEES